MKALLLLTILVLPSTFSLRIRHQVVQNLQMVQWQPVDTEGGTGSGSFSEEFLYSGDAFVITAVGLTNGGVLLESSLDLTNWNTYPLGGPILTLLPTNNSAIVIPDVSPRFFRGRWFEPSF